MLVALFTAFLDPDATLAQHDCKAQKGHAHAGAVKGGGPAPWPWDLLHLRIELDLSQGSVISGQCALTATPRTEGATQLPLQLLALNVDSVVLAGIPLPFVHDGEDLMIDLPGPIGMQDTITVTVHYRGDPALDPSGFGGLYTTSQYTYNLGVAFQSVPHSYGRAWFPCADNFTERSTYEFIITTNSAWNAWCNGTLLGEWMPAAGKRTRHWRLDTAIPAYLAAVAASDYVVVRDTLPSLAGEPVPVDLVAKPGDTTAMKSSFVNLPIALARFEEWFGAYRWERIGYVLTPLGAMEHATSIHYPQSIANGSLSYQDIMAHELAHSWFGNLVTCERAEEMYINEGFAEYLSFLFIEAVEGEAAYRDRVRANHRTMLLRAHLDDEGWWALADVPQEWTYGEHSYNKGADVLHTLRSYMGDSLFRGGLTSFLDAHALQHVNTLMLRDHLNQATGLDLTDYFNDWILQPGWAAFEVDSMDVAAIPLPDGTFPTTVHVQQKQRGPSQPYQNVPVTLSFMAADGTTWTDPEPKLLGGPQSMAASAPPFMPRWAILNGDERISLAQTFDADSITGPATRVYANADLRVTVNSTPHPFALRVEEYWVAADPEAEESFAYVVSPDRYWRILGSMPEGASISARFTYDGRPAPAVSFDSGLMQPFNGLAFREDSLVLLYRPDAHWPWVRHPNQTLNTVGNATDRSGRIDINGLRAGEYCLAWRKSPVNVVETTGGITAWNIHPNPAAHSTTVSTGGMQQQGVLELYDGRGRLVRWLPMNGDSAVLGLGGLARGNYQLLFSPAMGAPSAVGRVLVD